MESLEFIEKLCSAAPQAFQGFDILTAYAFGSRVSGRPRPNSDLDVGYQVRNYRQPQPLSIRDELHIADVLSAATGFEVDFRCLSIAPMELQGRVLVEGVRIFSANEEERVELETWVIRQYHDYAEEWRRMHEIRLQSHARR